MPPKKSQKKPQTEIKEDRDLKKENDTSGEEESNHQAGEKRKAAPTSTKSKEPSSKAAKTKQQLPEGSIIQFLLSPQALSFCQKEASESGEKDYFSPDLTPFQHLMCAVILSRPINHALGQRTIKTVLNEPWNWNNAEAILEAGKENEEGKTERVEAMEQARTQHRQKTASELGGLAQVVKDEKWDEAGDGSLEGLLNVVKGEQIQEDIRRLLKEKIKGVADTAVDIFLRRVQGCKGWEGIGWFVDGKTKDALQAVGLPSDDNKLRKLLEDSGENDIRGSFVVVLERTLGIFLEGKQSEIPL